LPGAPIEEDGPASSKWCDCVWSPKPQNPRPALGFYGSDNQATVNAQLDQMIAYGIDVVAVEWTDPVASNFFNRFLPAISSRNVKFVLLYDTAIRMDARLTGYSVDFDDPVKRGQFISDFQAFAASTSYFKHPKYLKLGNEPVLYLYVSRASTRPGWPHPARWSHSKRKRLGLQLSRP